MQWVYYSKHCTFPIDKNFDYLSIKNYCFYSFESWNRSKGFKEISSWLLSKFLPQALLYVFEYSHLNWAWSCKSILLQWHHVLLDNHQAPIFYFSLSCQAPLSLPSSTLLVSQLLQNFLVPLQNNYMTHLFHSIFASFLKEFLAKILLLWNLNSSLEFELDGVIGDCGEASSYCTAGILSCTSITKAFSGTFFSFNPQKPSHKIKKKILANDYFFTFKIIKSAFFTFIIKFSSFFLEVYENNKYFQKFWNALQVAWFTPCFNWSFVLHFLCWTSIENVHGWVKNSLARHVEKNSI